ncbi:alanine/glycine:cation symporter family protein [Woodsholea maritima]|uniref:alanine/glycine:cation symporter family protein n=1 Tax=Woodsholea maritima TaxID=240237 RepID=UPI000380DF28|nr:sodium:alanine symporter family protein [Woodsholea maritima]
MQNFYDLVTQVSDFLWSGPMVVLLLGTGLYFMIRLKFRPILRLFPAMGELWAGRKAGDGAAGAISPWQALSTALSGQVGTGNLAGVATAISLGGPGAVFWMWMTALVGMAAAYAESSLAVRYRETHPDGRVHGGPMYYIKNGLGKWWTWLGILFAIGTLFSALATGNMVQSNSITQAMTEASAGVARSAPCFTTVGRTAVTIEGQPQLVFASGCDIAEAGNNGVVTAHLDDGTSIDVAGTDFTVVLANWVPGIIIAVAVFIVIIGGIQSIGSFAGKVVPFMALVYVVAAGVILALNASHLPSAFMQIFHDAFTGSAATGGFLGSSIMIAMRFGVERGLFSNEAGQGSTAIAHAASKTDSPVRQGEIAMVGTFIDTIVICTITALVILVVQGAYPHGAETVDYAWMSQLEASEVTTAVFRESHIPAGGFLIAICLTLFAFTTILGWSYYAEQALTYLVGDWATKPFRFIWVIMVFFGALQQVDFIWMLGGIANAAMAAPNLIAILMLSGVVVAYTKKADKDGQGATPAGVDEKPAIKSSSPDDLAEDDLDK